MREVNSKKCKISKILNEFKDKNSGISLQLVIISIVILLVIVGVVIFFVTKNNNLNQEINSNNQTSSTQTNAYWNNILEDADSNPENYKYPEQTSDNIGIDSSGNPVNMDNWNFDESLGNNEEIILKNNDSSSVYTEVSSNIIIPEYVYINSSDNYYRVTGLGDGAFSNCTDLKSLTIPKSVNTIEQNVFHNCENLQDIYFNGSIEQWNEVNIDYTGNTALQNAIIHCSNGEISPQQ